MSDLSPALLPQGRGRKTSTDDGEMERVGQIQSGISLAIFAVCLAPYLLYSGGFQGDQGAGKAGRPHR